MLHQIRKSVEGAGTAASGKPCHLLDRSLEIEIIENVYAHRDQREPMQRIWGRCRQTGGHDVVWPVASDEGNAPLFQEIRNVGVISGEAGFPRPGTERGAPLPTPCIEKDDVAWTFDAIVLPEERHAPIIGCDQPALRDGDGVASGLAANFL
jgi:hypothetical protein